MQGFARSFLVWLQDKNYYFVVTTTHTPGENHLTEAEQDSRTVVEWHTFDEMVRLINEQEFDRVQGKYLKARDVVALTEYSEMLKKGSLCQ